LFALLLLALTVGVSSVSARSSSSDADRFIGTWSGTYAGDGTGTFTMVLSKDADNKLGGTVETTADGAGSYKATFKSVVVDGESVKMAYDEPSNSGIEVQLSATVDGGSLKGIWNSVDTGAKTVVASGTFTGSKR
jgi:hypothetical protein